MNAAGRTARDALIETMYRAKSSQTEIGHKVGLKLPQVHRILAKRGLLDQAIPRGQGSRTSTIWDMDIDPDKLRRAIHKRQREGARAALAAMLERQQ